MTTNEFDTLLAEANRCGAVMITADCLQKLVTHLVEFERSACVRVARETAVEYVLKGQMTYGQIADQVACRIGDRK
jgi:hypothetical protein